VTPVHPLLEPPVVAEIERAASAHVGIQWVRGPFVDLDERAFHPCGVFAGRPVGVFAKLGVGPDAAERFRRELAGLELLGQRAGIATPVPVATGLVELPAGALLLSEALEERPPQARTREDWTSIGRTLATVHGVRDELFGLIAGDGFFGPLRQDNRPSPSNRWVDFYAERRVLPLLRSAVDSGNLPADLATEVERVTRRLPLLGGPEPPPSLLHGDAQQNNFLSTDNGSVVIDAAPYFGHPEVDLALIDYFDPVPEDVFNAYRDLAPIDAGFEQRRELWRICGYLAVITVDGHSSFGRSFLSRLSDAVRAYR
jgi:fructosamine-3-kinase